MFRLFIMNSSFKFSDDKKIKFNQTSPNLEIGYFIHPKIGIYLGGTYNYYNEANRYEEIDGMVGVTTGIDLSMYVGQSKVTISADAEPQPVRIEMRKRNASDRYW